MGSRQGRTEGQGSWEKLQGKATGQRRERREVRAKLNFQAGQDGRPMHGKEAGQGGTGMHGKAVVMTGHGRAVKG
jgi:hypothetical protein